jgi:hypothetical protein
MPREAGRSGVRRRQKGVSGCLDGNCASAATPAAEPIVCNRFQSKLAGRLVKEIIGRPGDDSTGV